MRDYLQWYNTTILSDLRYFKPHNRKQRGVALLTSIQWGFAALILAACSGGGNRSTEDGELPLSPALADSAVDLSFLRDQIVVEDTPFYYDIPETGFGNNSQTALYSVSTPNGSTLPRWLNFDSQSAIFTGTPTEETDIGSFDVRVTANDNGRTISELFSIIVQAANDAPILRQALADQIAIEGRPFTFIIPDNSFFDPDDSTLLIRTGTLPDWLEFNQTTKTFSGRPPVNAPAFSTIEVLISDSNYTIKDYFDISVIPVTGTPTQIINTINQIVTEDSNFIRIIPPEDFQDDDGQDTKLSAKIIVTDDNGESSEDDLPDWLEFDENTGELSGTPEDGDAGTYIIVIRNENQSIASYVILTVTDDNDIDGNDTPPLFTSAATASISENTEYTAGDVIYRSAATPDVANDTVTYGISGGTDAGLFVIDTSSGEVRFANDTTPDYEDKASYEIEVTATVGDQTATQTITISVANLNDNVPILSVTGTQDSLNEGVYADATATGFTVTAADADGTTPVISLSDSRFEIGADGSLQIAAGSEFDHEDGDDDLTLTITATDATDANSSVSQDVTIAFNDVNDEAPLFTSATTASVDENTEYAAGDTANNVAGDVIYTSIATPDVANDTITYSLSGTDAGLFVIDTSSGEVRFANDTTPDHEGKASYALTVTATIGSQSASQDNNLYHANFPF